MILPTFQKTATAKRDYTVDWGTAYPSDTIASVSWSVPADLTTVATGTTPSLASIRLAGGLLDQVYVITCTVTLASGQVDRCSFQIAIVPRIVVLTATKDSGAAIDFTLDASALFGEAVSTYAWTPSGCTISGATNTSVVRATGGSSGAIAYLTCHLVSVGGQEDDRTIEISIQDR